MLKKIIRQFSKEQFSLEKVESVSSKRNSIIETKSTVSKKRDSNASTISNASYKIKELVDEFKFNNIYIVPITSKKSSFYENYIDSDDCHKSQDLNEFKYINKQLKYETNCGKLNDNEKEIVRELKKSKSVATFINNVR